MQVATTTPSQRFKKPNAALVMIPKVGSLSIVVRKLFNIILNESQKQILGIKSNGQIIEATHYFSKNLGDLLRPLQLTSNGNMVTHGKKVFGELSRIEVDWAAPDANSETLWYCLHLLSESRIEKEKDVLVAYWAFPPSLMQALEDPHRFTYIDIDQLMKLTTYASVALYEICSRYKTNPRGLTSDQPVEWWVDALTQTPKVDPVTGEVKLRPFPKFKDEKCNAAIKEINEKTDFTIELIEKKIGKTIVSAQFRIKLKKQFILENAPSISLQLAEKATLLDINLSVASEMLKQCKSEVILMDALNKLEARIARTDQNPIDSKTAYLRKILNENNKYIINSVTTSSSQTNVNSDESTEVKVELLKDYKDERRAEIRLEILNLPKETQKEYALAAFDQLRAAGQATTSMNRKMQCEEWAASPILFNKLIDVYAIKNYGEQWAVEQ